VDGKSDGAREGLRDLGELARLMEDFGAELAKLDEALKTLTAYLGRMRAQADPHERRVLH